MWNEFKQFALRGNVVDLAIGIIIGAAFGKIVDSLVGDIFMPVIGAATGGLDFSNYFTPLTGNVTATALAEAKNQGAVLAWGSFVTVAINFIIIAWILFLLVKGMNRLRRTEDAKTGTADKPP
jgi:large conductance mechanosensitive channel